MPFPERKLAFAAVVAAALAFVRVPAWDARPAGAPAVDAYQTFWQITRSPLKRLGDLEAWRRAVPQVRRVSIRSSADGTAQSALFYDSGSARPKPLLVALHSWSEDWRQFQGIPYGLWAVRHDWVLVHPNYRGRFTNPKATGSEEAVRDVLDAVDYAKRNARVDASRIYVTGFSGGAMAALLLVGRHPELWAGAAAWVPVYDLVEWYGTTRHAKHDYSRQIASSCGGAPLPGTNAERECRKRSPSSYLGRAGGSAAKVLIAAGVDDRFVPPGHAVRAFNDLADPADRIAEADIAFMNARHALPPGLSGGYSDPLFTRAGLPLVFERKSRNAVLRLFRGGHDVIYRAGLEWLAQQRR